MPRRHVNWNDVTNKPDLAALLHHHDSSYAPLSHNHDTLYYSRVEVDIMVGQRAAQTFVDAAIAGRAPINHNHDSSYVSPSSLATALLPYVDYTSLGMVLNGYEQTSNSILRFVQFDGLGHMQVRHQDSSGANVNSWLPMKSITDSLQYQATQNALRHSLHMGQYH